MPWARPGCSDATRPSASVRTSSQRLGATPRLLHRSRGNGAFALLEARKQAVHDASRRRERQERELATTVADAAQKSSKLETAAARDRARDRAHALNGIDARVWGADRSADRSHLDWQTWAAAVAHRDAQNSSPPPVVQLGGERCSEVYSWEVHTLVSQVKQRPRVADLKTTQ